MIGRAALLVTLALVPVPVAAAREGGDDETRVAGSCGRGASAQLRIRGHDGRIEVEFSVRRRREGERWRVVLVHERRVAWRGTLRTRGSSGTLRLRRSVPDFDGPDQVLARGSGPRGLTCVASAQLRG